MLPPLPKRQKKRKTWDRNAKKYRGAGRGKIPGRVDVDERPKTVGAGSACGAERRNLRLKPALQAQTKTAIIPTTSKKASSAQGYATSVAQATGWRASNTKE